MTFVCLGVIFFISLRQKSHKNKDEVSHLFGQSVTNDTSTIGWEARTVLLEKIPICRFGPLFE